MVEQKAVLIVGMHRSGTSATGHTLASLGVDFGDNLMPAAKDNPLGFQEDLAFVALNEELVEPVIGWQLINSRCKSNYRPEWTNRASRWWETFQTENASSKLIALKDPRICRTLPHWHDVIGKEVLIVYVVRHPAATSESLKKRNNFDRQFSLALWFVYNFEAFREIRSRGYEKIVIDYDSLVDGERDIRAELRSFLGLTGEGYSLGGIERSLRHNYKHEGDSFELYISCVKLYEALISHDVEVVEALEPFYEHLLLRYKALDDSKIELHQYKHLELKKIRSQVKQKDQECSARIAILEKRNNELEDFNNSILASRSWRITSPFRYMANKVRGCIQ